MQDTQLAQIVKEIAVALVLMRKENQELHEELKELKEMIRARAPDAAVDSRTDEKRPLLVLELVVQLLHMRIRRKEEWLFHYQSHLNPSRL